MLLINYINTRPRENISSDWNITIYMVVFKFRILYLFMLKRKFTWQQNCTNNWYATCTNSNLQFSTSPKLVFVVFVE